MEKNTLKTKRAYNEYAKEYIERVNAKKFHNNYVEVPAIKKILKNVKGKKILNAGCATGEHAKILFKKGADVINLDVSEEMIKEAKRKVPEGKFVLGDIQKLPFKKNSFDIVFYGLCLHYVEDIEKVYREAYRVLKKKGKIVFSTHNPCCTGQKRIKKGNKTIFIFDDYFTKEPERWEMVPGMKIVTYVHTISGLLNPLIKAGFKITNIVEPLPVKKAEKIDKRKYDINMRRPSFIIVEAEK